MGSISTYNSGPVPVKNEYALDGMSMKVCIYNRGFRRISLAKNTQLRTIMRWTVTLLCTDVVMIAIITISGFILSIKKRGGIGCRWNA
jgi:hypothetical protein